MHRIVYWTSTNAEEINRIKLAAFDAMIHGDKDVDEYIMFRTIRKAVSQRDKAFFNKPLSWSCMALECWYKEAVKGFDKATLSDYDIQSRINILLESDLYADADSNQTNSSSTSPKSTCTQIDYYTYYLYALLI